MNKPIELLIVQKPIIGGCNGPFWIFLFTGDTNRKSKRMPTNISCPEMKNGTLVVHVVNYTHSSTALLFLFWISVSSLFAIFWVSRSMYKQNRFSQPRFLAIAVCTCDFLYAGKFINLELNTLFLKLVFFMIKLKWNNVF